MKPGFTFALYGITLLFAVPAMAKPTMSCPIGTYRLANGSAVDIAPSENDTLRWTTLTGETGQLHRQINGMWTSTYGWTGRSSEKTVSFSDCNKGSIIFGKESGRRIAYMVSNTTFESGGVKLVGRLIMPPGNGKVPVVVLIHGSEHSSGIDTLFLQHIFPAQDIGAFVYDKRGTGRSGGVYTQDYNLLAVDAVKALSEARRLAGARLERIGYWGGSQGGWVVPLAANKAPVDFAIIAYGLAVSVIDEDQESVALDMHFHHHSAADTAKALELASAGEHVVATHGMDGYARFDALRQRYKSKPWYKDVHGDYLFMVLPLDEKQIIQMVKPFAATPFNYDPMPVLRASTTPQLWILGGDDLDAPSGETSKRIKSLIAEGKNFTLAVYPGAQHGLTLYELDAKGEHLSTRYAPGYFQMMADFIKSGRIGNRYGEVEITRPPMR
ncbi:MAG: alpha/beta hydrolase [Acidobacteriaceae bacterium]